jgi:hypothetical protein
MNEKLEASRKKAIELAGSAKLLASFIQPIKLQSVPNIISCKHKS